MYLWYLANPIVFKKEFSVVIQIHFVKPGTDFNLSKQDLAYDDYRSISFLYQHGIQPVQFKPYL